MNKTTLFSVMAASMISGQAMAMSKTPEPAPEPTPAPGKIVRFIAIGDMGTGEDGQYKVADVMEKVCAERGCDFAIGLGDNIYESGADSTDDIQFETKFEDPYAKLDFPFYMALGNHDNTWIIGGDGLDNDKGDIQVAYHYKENRTSDKWNMPARYYNFTAPANDINPLVEFFALDSNPLAGVADADHEYFQFPYRKKQANWFNLQLQNSTAPWKIAYAHHAYISNGRHNNAGIYDGFPGAGIIYRNFLKDNVCNQVDVMIAGHDHELQWLKPTDSCGKTFHMVSGAGGKTRDLTNRDRNEAYWQEDGVLGFFYIEIEGDEFRGTAYTVDKVSGEYQAAFSQTLTRQ
ncbi:metallophosphoesterase [Bacterioplanoides sp. SCSIO 12839]|uniref:metallophosphoesterase n=1 Tax=Bacterioplanoides sp. SCSIO 12839 TaxID=2829569 RepID=UPI0021034532|nr:metallophosphoesterase [Bacterioplanoides sp. SCSIO 12839]UTW47413.1 metallophosphoesterase [Bacterioplanoides sp. SCSIO 12839]